MYLNIKYIFIYIPKYLLAFTLYSAINKVFNCNFLRLIINFWTTIFLIFLLKRDREVYYIR